MNSSSSDNGFYPADPWPEHRSKEPGPEGPLVSVVLIFLDEERFLPEAVQSVFDQTYLNWELLLVDDGSTDASREQAQRYAQDNPEQVRYLEHPDHTNRGMSASRNLGFRQAKGEYIALLDADDIWLPAKLEQQVAILQEHPEASLLYGLAEYWRDWEAPFLEGKRNRVPTVPKLNYVAHPPELSLSAYPLGKESAPCPSCMLFTRAMIERIGGFEESFRGMYEDQAFLAKVYLNEHIYVSGEIWIRYRIHPDSCCSQVHAAGKYHFYRRKFLYWLLRYMLLHMKFNPKVLKELLGALKPYGLPWSGKVPD